MPGLTKLQEHAVRTREGAAFAVYPHLIKLAKRINKDLEQRARIWLGLRDRLEFRLILEGDCFGFEWHVKGMPPFTFGFEVANPEGSVLAWTLKNARTEEVWREGKVLTDVVDRMAVALLHIRPESEINIFTMNNTGIEKKEPQK